MALTLVDLRKRLKEAEQEVTDLSAAIRIMERYEGGARVSEVSMMANQPRLPDTGVINLDELNIPARVVEKKVTISDEVQTVIGRFGSQEFTLNHVVAALAALGKGSDAKHFKNRVSITIRSLVESGVIERTFKGVGNAPHKYRKTSQVSLVKKNQ